MLSFQTTNTISQCYRIPSPRIQYQPKSLGCLLNHPRCAQGRVKTYLWHTLTVVGTSVIFFWTNLSTTMPALVDVYVFLDLPRKPPRITNISKKACHKNHLQQTKVFVLVIQNTSSIDWLVTQTCSTRNKTLQPAIWSQNKWNNENNWQQIKHTTDSVPQGQHRFKQTTSSTTLRTVQNTINMKYETCQYEVTTWKLRANNSPALPVSRSAKPGHATPSTLRAPLEVL